MSQLNRQICKIGLIITSIIGVSTPAPAQLGDKVDTIDQLAVKTKLTKKPPVAHKDYSVHELTDGVVSIREYADKENKVFALAWDTLSQPDLSLLLGKYFDDFSVSVTHGGRPYGRPTQSEVRGEYVTVVKWGPMRAAHGKAYLHNDLPSGVKPEDIQ